MSSKKVERSLEETPTWAVAVVCLVFVAISILIEHGIQYLEKVFKKRQNRGMIEALEKIKSELMTLGFISLLLTVGTRFIPNICIPQSVGHFMLPCAKNHNKNDSKRRKLLSVAQDQVFRRILADKEDDGTGDVCGKDKESLISYYGIHQLHIFLFMLAIVHILYSISILALSQAKVKKWKAWEIETSSLEYEFTNDPSRFRFTHQTSFIKRHGRFSTIPGIRWIVAFFRMFFGSVTKVDYMTIRHGFINAHFAQNTKFDFHKYVKRSMQDDFKYSTMDVCHHIAASECIQLVHAYMDCPSSTRGTCIGWDKNGDGDNGNGRANTREDDSYQRSSGGGAKQQSFLVQQPSLDLDLDPFHLTTECFPDCIVLMDMGGCLFLLLLFIKLIMQRELK
ncbi:MLO protein homolog 1-like [Impatiens glandulifera]|uniref:MLO protein homolog 1-like n=1 Tax=Impatiens glandulifera TaxID=253017 RepID=UPI001FB18466|nr:MLO protein homolog 1-like [Impatiens glandulifera]